MAYSRKDILSAVTALLESNSRSATVFCQPLSRPTRRVKATRVRNPGRKGQEHIVLTLDRLNYSEKRHINKCIRAGVTPQRLLLKGA